MNSDKRIHAIRGNALIYILLALALLAALTMAISKQNDSSGGEGLDKEKAQLLATQMVSYAATVKNGVDQMMMSGTSIANLDYSRPSDAAFDVAPYHRKIFHPQGGGVTLGASDPAIFTSADTAPEPGWYLGRFNNVEWTPTAANDIVLAAYGISQTLCATLNKKITGSETIPLLGDAAEEVFVDAVQGGGAPNVAFTKALCPSCEGFPTLCVGDSAPEYVYYNIISGQ